jgi:hypothetical protein
LAGRIGRSQPVIVKGSSDQHYLTAIKTLLISDGTIAPDREIILSDLNRALSGHSLRTVRTLISILGYAGLLIDPERPDFRCEFVPDTKCEETPWYKDDWPYPVRWWNGSFGVNEAAINEWFSDLGNGG